MHKILCQAQNDKPAEFLSSLPALMGFSTPEILQLIYFHDFKATGLGSVSIHSYDEVKAKLQDTVILPFALTSSVEISLGDWALQIRVKAMNKFTTTAIKINCSVKKDS